MFAILTIVSLPYLGDYKPSYRSGEPMSLATALPHLMILASISAGFRRLGDTLALVIGIPSCLFFAAYALLSGLGGDPRMDPMAGQLALYQVVMVIAAAADLSVNRKLAHQPLPIITRAIGLSVPVAVLVGTSLLTNANVRGHRNEQIVQQSHERADARIRAAAWLNEPMLDELMSVARCVEQFRGDSIAGPAPKSLRAIYSWSRKKNTEPTACGYRMFETRESSPSRQWDKPVSLDTLPHPHWDDKHHIVYYQPPKNLRGDPFHRAAFTLGIEAVWDSTEFPSALGQPGTRNYFLDANGEIHVTTEHRRATVADPIVPVCAPGERDKPDHRECHEGFESRQRWGLVNRLPSFDISVVSVDYQGSVVADLGFQQVSALDSVRYVSVDWGENQRPTRIDIKPAESITHYYQVADTTFIRDFRPQVRHRYRDWGDKIVRAKLVTRAGAEYVASDTVFVREFESKSR